jgi:hypothetical protein
MSANEPIVSDDASPAPRKCGRCQQMFAGDADSHSAAIPDWWVCPTCREALFGADASTS